MYEPMWDYCYTLENDGRRKKKLFSYVPCTEENTINTETGDAFETRQKTADEGQKSNS